MDKNQQAIEEMNAVIAEIEKNIKPTSEIGTQNKLILRPLLQANKIDKKPKFFKCKREQAEKIMGHFIKKGVKKNKFSGSGQEYIYVID
jgi:hypothetical protein